MTTRADAHIHLFADGYQNPSFASRPGVSIDEAACYESLSRDHDVAAALVIGFAGEDWCADNNSHLADQVKVHDWIHPLAHVAVDAVPGVEQLENLQRDGFVGISLYLYDGDAARIADWSDESWGWLDERNWLVSVNADSDGWSSWTGVLARFPGLRLLISHLGEPPASTVPPEPGAAVQALKTVTDLATYPKVSVKLSGFYAVSTPGHDYPHVAAWPYVEQLLTAFGSNRLVWGSDFSPSLDWVTFPQTIDLFEKMPFLDHHDVDAITGKNLLALLSEVHRPGSA